MDIRERPRGRGRPKKIRPWVHIRGESTNRNLNRGASSVAPEMEEEKGEFVKN